ncbi:MAG: iron-containing alcohol dehydrogenase [Rhodospirillales bacterium]
MDSLTHALEAYVSRRANPYSDAMALSAMALIGPNLRTAYREPRNAQAREALMIGAHHAGLAFTNASVALVHGMSRPEGAHFPRRARPFQRHAAAGDHQFLARKRPAALRRRITNNRLRPSAGRRRCGRRRPDPPASPR